MFRALNESFRAHISISCSPQCLSISVFEKYRLLWTEIATSPFHIAVYSNRLLHYNLQYEHYSIVNTLNDVLSSVKHEGRQDANDLIVH